MESLQKLNTPVDPPVPPSLTVAKLKEIMQHVISFLEDFIKKIPAYSPVYLKMRRGMKR